MVVNPIRLRWRFHNRSLACAFFRNERGLFVSVCNRYIIKRIGVPEIGGGKPPPSIQRCPLCDSRYEMLQQSDRR